MIARKFYFLKASILILKSMSHITVKCFFFNYSLYIQMMLIQHFVLLEHISSVGRTIFLIQLYDKADACDDYTSDGDDDVVVAVEDDDYVHFVQKLCVVLLL